jgi:hypothetical protein
MAGLQMLRWFTIKDAPNIMELPEDLVSLQFLETVTLQDCGKLKTLPSAIVGRLEKGCLQRLEVRGCNSLTALPPSIGDLKKNLKDLQIARCERIQTFPPEVVLLENLRRVTLDYTTCPAFSRIPKSLFELRRMPKLDRSEVRRWHSVESNFPSEIYNNWGESLQELELSDCDRFINVLRSVDKLRNLKKFRVRYRPSFCNPYRQSRLDPKLGHDAAILNLKKLPRLESLLLLDGIVGAEAILQLFSEQQRWTGSTVLREIGLINCRLRKDSSRPPILLGRLDVVSRRYL